MALNNNHSQSLFVCNLLDHMDVYFANRVILLYKIVRCYKATTFVFWWGGGGGGVLNRTCDGWYVIVQNITVIQGNNLGGGGGGIKMGHTMVGMLLYKILRCYKATTFCFGVGGGGGGIKMGHTMVGMLLHKIYLQGVTRQQLFWGGD